MSLEIGNLDLHLIFQDSAKQMFHHSVNWVPLPYGYRYYCCSSSFVMVASHIITPVSEITSPPHLWGGIRHTTTVVEYEPLNYCGSSLRSYSINSIDRLFEWRDLRQKVVIREDFRCNNKGSILFSYFSKVTNCYSGRGLSIPPPKSSTVNLSYIITSSCLLLLWQLTIY